MIKFRCGACGRKMGVPDGYGGKRVKCTGCGEGIRVPAPGGGADAEELVTLEPVEEEHDHDLDPDGGIFDDLMPTDTPMAAAQAAVGPAGRRVSARARARPAWGRR